LSLRIAAPGERPGAADQGDAAVVGGSGGQNRFGVADNANGFCKALLRGPSGDALLLDFAAGAGQAEAGGGDGCLREFGVGKSGSDGGLNVGLSCFKASSARIAGAGVSAAEDDRVGVIFEGREPGDGFGATAVDAEEESRSFSQWGDLP